MERYKMVRYIYITVAVTSSVYLYNKLFLLKKNYINRKDKRIDIVTNYKTKKTEKIQYFENINIFKKTCAHCDNIHKHNDITYNSKDNSTKESEPAEKEILSWIEEEKECLKEKTEDLNKNDELCSFENGTGNEKTIPNELSEEMKKQIEDILSRYKVVLFMKGTALNPFCKFSKEAIHILKLNQVKEIHTVNVLNNPELRNCLKIYSNWPTFPQLYVHQKFIGGIDKVKELHENNKLKEILKGLVYDSPQKIDIQK